MTASRRGKQPKKRLIEAKVLSLPQYRQRRIRGRVQELKALAAMADSEIDTSDIPEVIDWTGAKRGMFYREGN